MKRGFEGEPTFIPQLCPKSEPNNGWRIDRAVITFGVERVKAHCLDNRLYFDDFGVPYGRFWNMTENSEENSEYNTLSGSEEDAPVHLVISNMRGAIWIKPSRPVNRQRMIGVLTDALFMLQSSAIHTIHPDDCGLRVLLTVDEDQMEVPD